MYIDIVLLGLLVLGFYSGYSKGIVKTVFALISIVVAVIASMTLSPLVIDLLGGMLSWDPRIIVILGFLTTFSAVVVGVRYAGKLIEHTLKGLQINFINKLVGGAVMATLFITIFSFLIGLMDKMNLISEDSKESSITYGAIEPLPRAVAYFGNEAKPLFKNFWDRTTEAMEEIKEEADQKIKEED